MSAKKRKKPGGQSRPPVSEYSADYRDAAQPVPEKEKRQAEPDSLSFSVDYRDSGAQKPSTPPRELREDDKITPEPSSVPEQLEEADWDAGWGEPPVLDLQAEEVVIDAAAYDAPVEEPDPDPERELVTGGEILSQEDLPEEEEPILEKAEAEQLGEVVLAAARPRRKRRKYGIPMGIGVLALALVGVVFLAITIGQAISRSMNDDSKLREYDSFLAPVVMQDPAPFESIGSADPEFVMTASLWFAISQNGAENYNSFDAEGRSLIPLGDVTAACRDLFGPDCVLQPATPKEETFFTFDSEDNQFHVAPYSSQSSYTPYTEKERRSGGSVLLTVGYLSPADDYLTDETKESKPKPAKYMEYELKTNSETGKLYIYAIRAVQQL